MERKDLFANVAFGGAWSERLADTEAMISAMDMIEAAAGRTLEEDLRQDRSLAEAVDLMLERHPRAEMVRQSWHRALAQAHGAHRHQEISRIARALREWAGQALRI